MWGGAEGTAASLPFPPFPAPHTPLERGTTEPTAGWDEGSSGCRVRVRTQCRWEGFSEGGRKRKGGWGAYLRACVWGRRGGGAGRARIRAERGCAHAREWGGDQGVVRAGAGRGCGGTRVGWGWGVGGDQGAPEQAAELVDLALRRQDRALRRARGASGAARGPPHRRGTH